MRAKAAGRLSVFAGTGALVPHIVQAALAGGFKVQMLTLGPREPIVGVKIVQVALDNPLGIIWALKVFRTTHVVMAGSIQLPDKAREGLIRFANGGAAASDAGGGGPIGDAALGALGKVLKKMTGADLIGVQDLSPDLLAPEGRIAGPDCADLPAARFALQTARAIGALDIGQAAVTSGRRVIAVEDIAGTDALIERVGAIRERGLAGDGAAPLMLAKARQPQQSGFVDLPSIGPQTIENCASAGIAGIAIEAGNALVIDRPGVEAAAARLGIAVTGMQLADD